MKKTKKYVLALAGDGVTVVWALHADLTFTMTALRDGDLEGTATPIVDLRDYGGETKAGDEH